MTTPLPVEVQLAIRTLQLKDREFALAELQARQHKDANAQQLMVLVNTEAARMKIDPERMEFDANTLVFTLKQGIPETPEKEDLN